MFNRESRRVLTEEQGRILEETELDRQKIFFGGAGSGKTFLAMEKAKRLSGQGKDVFLTCFNRNLARYLYRSLAADGGVTAMNFHDYLIRVLAEHGHEASEPEDPAEKEIFFKEILPNRAFELFAGLTDEERFDSIIVDEGQDFKADWIACLECMLKPGGEFYIFADPNQSLFQREIEDLRRLEISKHRLTRNLRNTESINQWIAPLLPSDSTPAKSQLKGGLPVATYAWGTPDEERRQIKDEIGRLVSQGIQPRRILILSPHVKEKSCLAEVDKIRDWPVSTDLGDERPNALRFATIRLCLAAGFLASRPAIGPTTPRWPFVWPRT